MGYGSTVNLERLEEKAWNLMREQVKIYELALPKYSKVSKLKGKTGSWKTEDGGTSRYYYSSNDNVAIWEVVEVWENPKRTVKVIVAGEGWYALFSTAGRIEGFTSLNYQRYSETPCDIFDKIVKGTFLAVDGRDNDSRSLHFVVNEPSIEDAERILEGLHEIYKIRSKFNNFKWTDKQTEVPTYGNVQLMDVLKQRVVFDGTLRNFKWKKRKDTWDLMNAVKANLSIKNDGKRLKVKATALDGNLYSIETPIIPTEEEKSIGWGDGSIFKAEFWLSFVYRPKNDHFWNNTQPQKIEILLNNFLNIPYKVPESEIILGFNNRRVTVTRKKTTSGAVINYLDGKIVKSEEITEKMKAFFLLGKPILPAPKVKSSNKPQKKVMSKDAQELIDKGLNGSMRDLEGDFPFHLNVIYKEDERKWYLEMAGKEFYIKGGYNALNKVGNAVRGRGLVQNRDELGWDCRDTKVLRHRIGELVGDENALWIILQVKRMGALYKVMGAGGET